MKLNLVNTSLILGGLLLIYSAIKDVDPRTAIQNGLRGEATSSAITENESNAHKNDSPIPKPGSVKPKGNATAVV